MEPQHQTIYRRRVSFKRWLARFDSQSDVGRAITFITMQSQPRSAPTTSVCALSYALWRQQPGHSQRTGCCENVMSQDKWMIMPMVLRTKFYLTLRTLPISNSTKTPNVSETGAKLPCGAKILK